MEDTPTTKRIPPRTPLSWRAYEYLHTEKNVEWYWALGLVAVAGSALALYLNNILFAVLILVAAFVLAILASRKPDMVTFTLTQRGVRIADTLHPYQDFESFAIDELSEAHTPKLILVSSKIFFPNIVIPLEGVDPDEVHEFLREFLPEGDHSEPLVHKVMEYFGF